MKPLTSSYDNPIDVVPISSMPSKDLVPFDEEYVIPSGSDDDIPSDTSSEQLDEEIKMDEISSTPIISSPMPQFTAEEAGVKEMNERRRCGHWMHHSSVERQLLGKSASQFSFVHTPTTSVPCHY